MIGGGQSLMATIYKRDKRKKNEPYSIQYVDHAGKRRTTQGFTDKGLSEQLAAKLEAEARLRRTGLIDPEQERLAECKQSSLEELMKAFRESLSEQTAQYILHTTSRLRKIVEGCGFKTLAEIEAEAVVKFMRSLRKTEKIGPRTYNHYLQAADAFCNWCVATKRLMANPLTGVERLNPDVDVRHKRRALTGKEFALLLKSARKSGIRIQRFSGEQRARIYTLSFMTGLRRRELGSLTPRSFDLAGNPPTLTVEAANSKHRKKDVLPLHPELVELVRKWMKGLEPCDKLFPQLDRRKTWLMVKKDLERVGIPYVSEDGIADFHAAGRHTHITELLRSGATLPEAQKLARHSDIHMTMKYAHIGIDDQAKAVANLPTAALHGRCISGGPEGQSVATRGKTTTARKRQNPCESKGFGNGRHAMAKSGKVEDRGLEPLTFWLPARRSPN
jgi:integrase